MKHFLTLLDYSPAEIQDLLDLAVTLKAEQKTGKEHKHLAGKTIGLLFEKASTRTRVSFEVGAVQLGMYPLFLSSKDLQIGRGEPIQDTARVLSRYLDAIMIRTFADSILEDLAQYGSVPIINGLTDGYHPCQALADLLTIQEQKGSFEGLTVCYLGDGNNVANSTIIAGLKMGMTVKIGTPKDYQPMMSVLKFAKTYGDKFVLTDNPEEAISGVDVVYTDTWASMGQESEEAIRIKAMMPFQVNGGLMRHAKPNAMVLHCLPAYREKEITDEVFEQHANEIFDQAENRLHAQKAIMLTLIK